MSVLPFYTQKESQKSFLSDCLQSLFLDSSDPACSGHAKKEVVTMLLSKLQVVEVAEFCPFVCMSMEKLTMISG